MKGRLSQRATWIVVKAQSIASNVVKRGREKKNKIKTLDQVTDDYWCPSKQQDQCISSSKEEKNREHMEPAPTAYVYHKYDGKMKDCNVTNRGGQQSQVQVL